MKLKLLATSFLIIVILTFIGVVFFFDPIRLSDQSLLNIHPLIGFLTYVSLCLAIFEWANRELSNAYKSAFIVAVPQMVLIVDLVLRGARGFKTGIAGIIMLAVTWFTVAFVYKALSKKLSGK